MTVRSALGRIAPQAIRRLAGAGRARRTAARVEGELLALTQGQTPIVAGPWLGEVGFELLYWMPFLAWVVERFAVAPERLIVVSRGGTANWYTSIAGSYIDVFEWIEPAEFRRRQGERVRELGEQKQRRATSFEHALVEESRRRAGAPGAAVLHPGLMYELMSPYWWGHAPLDWVFRFTRHRRLDRPAAAAALCLPDAYTAVKFYFNDCFPDTAGNRAFAAEALRRIAETSYAVSLAGHVHLDDHTGIDLDDGRVVRLPPVPARDNLRLQEAVVAGARAFAGTYGGFSYLAPFHGVPATAYYSDAGGFSPRHLDLAQAALARIGLAGLLQVRSVS